MNCKICGKPLNKSQYKLDKNYKSCPRCSVINGEEHVFFNYPESFGKSIKRRTANDPDGAQSHCSVHRSEPDREIPAGGVLCSKLSD